MITALVFIGGVIVGGLGTVVAAACVGASRYPAPTMYQRPLNVTPLRRDEP